MTGRVTVQDELFERQGIKVVAGADGAVREIPPGALPAESDTLLGLMGEPSFCVRVGEALQTDADVPDEVGLGIRRAGRRLLDVEPEGWVEAVVGPVLEDGVLVLWVDTDGRGPERSVVAAMVAILVEELEPLDVDAEVMAGPGPSEWLRGSWLSTKERAAAALRP